MKKPSERDLLENSILAFTIVQKYILHAILGFCRFADKSLFTSRPITSGWNERIIKSGLFQNESVDRSRIYLSTQDQCKKWHVKLLMSILLSAWTLKDLPYHGCHPQNEGKCSMSFHRIHISQKIYTYKNFISD